MKRILSLAILLVFFQTSFSNGLLTNTNQSTQFQRMMSRNASLGIDAVYYNPAGLIKLEDGWHFSVHSQTVFQTRNIDTQFPWLNDGNYSADVLIPVFPTVQAAYKMDRWALSFGFGPNAGGGSAIYDRGLPSFEIPISKLSQGLSSLTPLLTPLNLPTVSDYDASLYFEGMSVFWGLQFGVTYEVSEMLSVVGGVRYTPTKNTYLGSIRDITMKTSMGDMSGENYLILIDPVLTETIGVLNVTTTTLDAAIKAGHVDPGEEVSNPQLVEIMTLLGNPEATNQQALDIISSTNASLKSVQGADVVDQEVDVVQTGSGLTPIVGANVTVNEFVNIGLRYEHKTYMTVENQTNTDDLGLFPDGAKSRSDIPGIIAGGIGLTDNYWFEAQLSFNMYLDKYVDWGANVRELSVWDGNDINQIIRKVENNSFDVALGIQFNATDVFSISAGAMYQRAGVADSYNSDFSFTTPSYTAIGGGIMWKMTERLTLDAALTNILYPDAEVRYFDPALNSYYDESYGKESFSFALGLSYSIPY